MRKQFATAMRWMTLCWALGLGCESGQALGAESEATPLPDTLAQRVLACTGCHGPQGRASAQGYIPRIAGKPAGYLHQQLLGFRDGRRQHAGMARLLEHLSDDYLRAIADHFAGQGPPFAAPVKRAAPAESLALGQRLVKQGDEARRLPACTACHGAAMTGVAPAIPGLLGLPRDYIVAQLGAWRTGGRQARAPDCMADLAKRLQPADIVAVADWLAAEPVPVGSAAPVPSASPAPMDCGSVNDRATAVPAAQAKSAGAVAPGNPITRPAGHAEASARGAYLARLGNCAGCHTARGGAAYAGGRGLTTPFGTVYAGNLTPDVATGLGAWSADDFWRALHHGQGRDGRWLVPAFPYTEFTLITREDSDSLFAHLRSLAPVVQTNRPHALGFPFNTQLALAAWRALYFRPARFEPEPARSAAWNRGAYLVRGLGHCAACHAPRNARGATVDALALRGGQMPLQPWFAPALGMAGTGEKAAADLIRLLKTGRSSLGVASGPMAEVVVRSSQHWTDADLRAVAIYLQSLPATTSAVANHAPAAPRTLKQGAALYGEHCAACHGQQGEGAAGAVSPLAGNPSVRQASATNLIQAVLHGGFAPTTAAYPQPYGMPPQALSHAEVAAVLSHVRQSWGNDAPAVSEVDVLLQR